MSQIVNIFKSDEKVGKPIEVLYAIDNDGSMLTRENVLVDLTHRTEVEGYYNVALISKGKHFDVIAAWDEWEPNCVEVFLGHWNDGFVKTNS